MVLDVYNLAIVEGGKQNHFWTKSKMVSFSFSFHYFCFVRFQRGKGLFKGEDRNEREKGRIHMFFLYATAKTISDIFACFSYYPRHPEKGKWAMRALAANTPTRFGSYFEFFYVLLLVKKKRYFYSSFISSSLSIHPV